LKKLDDAKKTEDIKEYLNKIQEPAKIEELDKETTKTH
jgi:hypothetical protein